MKLYNLRKTWVRSLEPDCQNLIFYLDHIDGMYSYCTDTEGNVCHFQAWMEVEPLTQDEISQLGL